MTIRLLPIALALGAALCLPAPARAQHCPPATKKIGERTTQQGNVIVRQPVCQRMTRAEMQARVAELDARIKDVRSQLVLWKRDHIPQVRGELEEWESLAREARTDIYISAGSAILGTLFTDAMVKQKAVGPLAAEEREELRRAGRKVLPSDPEKLQVLKERIQTAEGRAALLEVADWGREVAAKGTALGLAPDARSHAMTLAFGAAAVATREPHVRLMFTLGEFGVAYLWGLQVLSLGREQVDLLSTVAGREAQAMTRLGTLYRDTFEERDLLRRKLAEQ